jgi:sulfatase maturation enzyme AslB (radical SAM superfamily)
MSHYSKQKSRYSIELVPEAACNFRCDYCFEHGTVPPKKNVLNKNLNLVIKQIEKIFNDPWFYSKFEDKNITFWGGEPTLNIDFIEKIVDYFLYREDVTFYIYSNGSRMHKLLPILLRCKDIKSVIDKKFDVQISYDGEDLQNLHRKLSFKSKKTSAEIVKENIELLYQNRIKFSLKSTISYKDFHLLENTWDEFADFYKRYKIRLALTPDYHNVEFYKYRDKIERTLLNIAKKELQFYKEHGQFLSNILNGTKMYCGCGKAMASFNSDGKMYYCHGCFYSKKINEAATIFDDNLIETIKHNYNYFFENSKASEDCVKCVALTCLKCNVKKFEESNKENFLERWYDYTNQEELCEYYKLTGKIGRAILNILEEK